MSLSKEIIKAIRQRINKGLPYEIRTKGILHIADTFIIATAAHKQSTIIQKVIDGFTIGQTQGIGRTISSTVNLPPAYAAFVNCALAHALDFDDIHDAARVHPTPVVLAAALAAGDVAEIKHIDLISAVVIGNELVCRLSYAIEPKGTGPDANWFLSQLFGYVGAAVTAGLVMGLDDEQLVNAIGLAYMQAAGGKEAGVGVGSQARAIYPAFAAMGGVQAALLAKAGVTAPESSLDGKTGLFQNYLHQALTEKQKNTLLNEEDWVFTQTAIKLYPCCRYSHPYVEAAIHLLKKVKLEQIEKIIIGVNHTANVLCEPLAARCQPTTLQDAKFSIPFLVAFTFVHGDVNLNNLTDKALKDENVLKLTQKIEIHFTQEDAPGIPIGDIQLVTSTNSIRHEEILSPETTMMAVKKKFIACCQSAGIENVGDVWNMMMSNLDFDILSKLPIIHHATN